MALNYGKEVLLNENCTSGTMMKASAFQHSYGSSDNHTQSRQILLLVLTLNFPGIHIPELAVAVWPSGNSIYHINKVLCQTQLVLGWVTAMGILS